MQLLQILCPNYNLLNVNYCSFDSESLLFCRVDKARIAGTFCEKTAQARPEKYNAYLIKAQILVVLSH